VARELNAIVAVRSKPLMIVSDNSTELTLHTILRWQQELGVGWHNIAPAKPVQNAFVESLNGGASATSASTSTCSVACRWHGGLLKPGGWITMPAGRTPASAVWPQTSLQPGPNRTTTGTDSGYE
jgi:transposase InsO family protein